jgi:F0F1-type ATP synthase membrane subunit b/b'
MVSIIGGVIFYVLSNKKSEKSGKEIKDKIEKMGEKLDSVGDKVAKDALGKAEHDIKEMTEKSVDEIRNKVNKVRNALDEVSKDL